MLLTNEDIRLKHGFPRPLKYKKERTNIIYSPKRKLKNDEHWTCYIYDRNLKKQVWIEIDKEKNINAAKSLSQKAATEYYLNNKDNKRENKKKDKNIDFLVSHILENYIEWFTREQYKKIDAGKKLKSTATAHISSKSSNAKTVDKKFGQKDIRQLTEKDFYNFMESRLKKVGKGNIGNCLSLFSTSLNHTLNRNAGKRRTRAITELNEELKRLITLIKYFRQDHDLTVAAALKESKKNKSDGHGRIEYFKFKEIIEWLRDNEKIDAVYADFFTFLYWQSNRVGEASKLQGRNIIIEGDTVKLKVPSILTKTGTGGTYSLHPEIEEIFRRRKEDMQDEDYIFSVFNQITNKRQEMNRWFYRKVWDKIKMKFELKLKDGRYMTPHVLRHSCINNIGDSMRANIAAFTSQSQSIVDHYLSDETANKNELFQLLAWQHEQEESLKEEQRRKDKKAVEKNIKFLDDFATKVHKDI